MKPARTSDVAIEDALRRKAEKGDVDAARALLDWRKQAAIEAQSNPAKSDPMPRAEVLSVEQSEWVMAWIEDALMDAGLS